MGRGREPQRNGERKGTTKKWGEKRNSMMKLGREKQRQEREKEKIPQKWKRKKSQRRVSVRNRTRGQGSGVRGQGSGFGSRVRFRVKGQGSKVMAHLLACRLRVGSESGPGLGSGVRIKARG